MQNNSGHLTRRRRLAFVLALPFAFCLLPFALSAQQQSQNASIEAGRRIYVGSCSMGYCHGLNGAGGGGPKLAGRKLSVRYLTQVISNGVEETTMPAFKDRLTKEQLDDLIAYLQTLTTASATDSSTEPAAQEHLPTSGNKSAAQSETAASSKSIAVAITAEDRELMGNVASGRELFFGTNETTNCRVCHTVNGIGGRIGPDLTPLTSKPAKEILQSITSPHDAVDGKYSTFVITLRDGQRFAGIKRDEDETTVRLYDTASLPPVSRTFLKSEVAKTETLKTSPMPDGYNKKYSRQQLLDLVGFLKTGGSGEFK
ncbi:MAG: c-type cytochrome [Blastocatellales bacterium]